MQKLIYPCKVMNISQSYDGQYSHVPNFTGNPCDYPWDEAGADAGRDWFYAPCDLCIARIAGVKNSATNTVWLESVAAVETPGGSSLIAIMVIHPEDDDLSRLSIGQTFKQGQQMFREGKDGKASGNHFHISTAKGRISGNGWQQNSKGAWVIRATGINVKPEEAFFITEEIKILDTKGLKFKKIEEADEMKVFKNLNEVPVWAQDAVKRGVESGYITVDQKGEFAIWESNLQTASWMCETGLWDRGKAKSEEVSNFAKNSVEKAIAKAVISGNGKGNLMLHSPITKEEVVVLIDKAGIL